MYAYTRFNAYRRRKEISGIGLQARRSLAGNLYNDFHLLLFGGSWDRDRGLSRLSPWTGSCAPPPRAPRVLPLHSTFATGIARGYPEVSQNRNRSRQGGGASGGLALPLSRGWHRPPLCTLRLGGPCSRRQSSPEDSANRSRRPDASPTNPSDSLTLATLPLLSNMRYKFAIRLVRGIRMGE